jgi:hypothetical protein
MKLRRYLIRVMLVAIQSRAFVFLSLLSKSVNIRIYKNRIVPVVLYVYET